MVNNQAQQRARRANAAGTNRKPVRIVNITKTPAKSPRESPAAPSQQDAPQRAAAEKVPSPMTPVAGAMVAEEDEGLLTRREVVASSSGESAGARLVARHGARAPGEVLAGNPVA